MGGKRRRAPQQNLEQYYAAQERANTEYRYERSLDLLKTLRREIEAEHAALTEDGAAGVVRAEDFLARVLSREAINALNHDWYERTRPLQPLVDKVYAALNDARAKGHENDKAIELAASAIGHTLRPVARREASKLLGQGDGPWRTAQTIAGDARGGVHARTVARTTSKNAPSVFAGIKSAGSAHD